MTFSETLKKNLGSKHVLLDTCVLSFLQNNIEKNYVEYFFSELFILKCPIVTNDLIKLEYLRDSKTLSQAKKKQILIEELCEASLPIRVQQDLFKDAVEISNIYKYRGVKDIGLVDILTSSFLKIYSSSLVIVTRNHNDFPLLLHDRLGTVIFDEEQEVLSFSFYQFNPKSFISCLKKFPQN